jgi:hemoglobin/transferrin/lactoferrin receptor protein
MAASPVRILVVLSLLTAGWLAHAGDTTVFPTDTEDAALDEIVVVANKAERRLREVAANVTVLRRAQLADNLSLSLGDSFRYAPGIDEELAGSRFGSEGITIRGIGGNRVALVLDGVPLGDQFDIGNFSNATRDFIDAGFIQRTEVLHGPASALYGSDAVGGVVAVRTIAPAELAGGRGVGGAATATYRGADDSRHATALTAFGDSGRGVLLGASLRDGGSNDSAALEHPVDERDFRRRAALVRFLADDAFGRSINAGILYQDSAVESDLHSMLGTERFATTTALAGNDHSRLGLAYAELGFGDPAGVVDAGLVRLYAGNSEADQHTLDVRGNAPRPVVVDRHFTYEQAFHGLELNLHRDLEIAGITHRLGAGAEYRRTRTEELRDGTETGIEDGMTQSAILGEVFPLRDFPVTDTDEWGAYLEDTMQFSDFSVIAALRSDRYELSPRSDSIYAEDNPQAVPVALSESDLSPKLGLIWHVADDVDLYLQYAHGFRAPPFEDANIGLDIPLFNIRAIPNPDLESEQSDGWDVGLRMRGDRGHLHIAVFRTLYRDFIESKARIGIDPDSGRILFQSRNLSEASIEGIEAAFSTALPGLPEELSVDGAFYIARGENGENGEPLNSVGPAQAVLGLAWRAPDGRRQLRLVTTLTDAWTERDETAGELFEPAAVASLDLLFAQALGERTVLRAGLMNLTDRTWWQWSGVRGLSSDDPLLPTLAQPGRNLSVGLEWNW